MSTPVADELVGSESRGRWLDSVLHDNWPLALCRLLAARAPAVVRVLVAEVRGSAPREPGACLLVSADGSHGTIGGGNLEWQAMRAAQELLAAPPASRPVRLHRLVLGRELAQCCGGVVQLWLERFTAVDLPLLRRAAAACSDGRAAAIVTELCGEEVVRRLLTHGRGELQRLHEQLRERTPGTWLPPASRRQPRLQFSSPAEGGAILVEAIEREASTLWLYGAGHVGQALIRILAELPFSVTWIDPRWQLLPSGLPDTVRALCAPAPASTVTLAPPGARFLVMTHDHALDYALCRRILERGDCAWLGLIGSKSKGARFRSRLARDGLSPVAIAGLTCPIGVPGVGSKWPAAIAVGVAAQLLQNLRSADSGHSLHLSACATAGAAAGGCPSGDCTGCSSAGP
jgi:xanthine dehydrogenase accessory factor